MWIQDAFGHGEVKSYEWDAGSNEMIIALQPISKAQDGRIGFYEALLRIPASSDPAFHAHLIRLAEQFGFIGRIDLYVLSQAVAVLERFPGLSLAVNIAPQSIEENGATILKRLAVSKASQNLIIELTETTDAAPTLMTAFTQGIHNLGARLAVDDFEIGFSDEERVLMVKPHFIKVVFEDHSATNIERIQRSIALARKIGADVVLEKVDSQKKIEIAEKFGIGYLQGYAIGRPILLTDFTPPMTDRVHAPITLKDRLAPSIRAQFTLAVDALNGHADVGLVEETRG